MPSPELVTSSSTTPASSSGTTPLLPYHNQAPSLGSRVKNGIVNFYRGKSTNSSPTRLYTSTSSIPEQNFLKMDKEQRAKAKARDKEKILQISKKYLSIMDEGKQLLGKYNTLKATALDSFAKAEGARNFKDYGAMSASWTKAHITMKGQYERAYSDAMRSLSIYPALLSRYQTKLQGLQSELKGLADTRQTRAMSNDVKHYYLGVKKAQNWLSVYFKRKPQHS